MSLPTFADIFPFRCTFNVGRRPQSWVRYHATLEEATASVKVAISKEFPDRRISNLVVAAV